MPDAIAVVIPARNASDTIGAAISSVLGQSRAPAEVVVVDDDSADGTGEAARAFGPPVTVLAGPGRGPAAARNAGVRASAAPWIAFLDADDVWLPTALEVLERALAGQQDAGLAFADVLLSEGGGPDASFLARKRHVASGRVYEPLLRECFILTSTVLATRAALEEAGLFDESADFRYGGEDWDLWLRIARRRALAAVRTPVARRRFESTNLSADSFRVAEARVKVLRKHRGLDAVQSIAPPGLIDQELGRWLLSFGYLQFLRGQTDAARQALLEGAALFPPSARQRLLLRAACLPAPLARAASRLWRARSRPRSTAGT